ncbi:DNA polymerase III subunit delta' [candidate division KSB1 bacterium]
MFSQLINQNSIKHYFSRAFASGKPHHAYLFFGPDGTGKAMAAVELARVKTCMDPEQKPCGTCASCVKFKKFKHPDIMLVFPVPGSLKSDEIQEQRELISEDPYLLPEFEKNASIHIGTVREIKNRLRLQSYQAHGRVVIILGADRLTLEAANALLKLLEEPQPDITFILTTSFPDSVLATIKSRCQQLFFSYLSDKTIADALVERDGISENDARFIASLSGGSYTRARMFLHEDFVTKREICTQIIETSTRRSILETVMLVEELSSIKKSGYREINMRSVLELLLAMFKIAYEQQFQSAEINVQENGQFNISVESLRDKSLPMIKQAIEEVEKSVDLMNKNVYLSLILLILFSRLHQVFQNV